MGYIYMLTSPSGKAYIGQTILPIEVRFQKHQQTRSKCRAIYNAIQYHGWDNFEKNWYECPDDDLNDHEELMIEVLGTLSPGGYNLIEGGGNNGKRSEETKQKMSEAQRGEKSYMFGIPKSDETKQKMSESRQGEKNHRYGKPMSIETKQKQSEAKRGENHPMFGKTGDKQHNSKRVYQYALDGTYIRSFGSTGEAGRHLEKDNGSSIAACARGDPKRKTAYNYKWAYIKY